jgi:hypothetical protein
VAPYLRIIIIITIKTMYIEKTLGGARNAS